MICSPAREDPVARAAGDRGAVRGRERRQRGHLGEQLIDRPHGAVRSRRADRRRLLGDVDGDRAPGDAAPAADAARGAELVDPGRELVGHPLPVARARRAPDAAAVDVGVVEREAGVPHALALGLVARRGRSCPRPWCRSRSGRPSCSCRSSGSARRPRPSAGARGCRSSRSRMSVVSSARPIVRGARSAAAARRARRSAASAARGSSSASTSAPRVAADLDEEAVAAVVEQLGQREVEARRRARAGVHRRAEAGAAGLPAVDRDEERARGGGPRSRARRSGRR